MKYFRLPGKRLPCDPGCQPENCFQQDGPNLFAWGWGAGGGGGGGEVNGEDSENFDLALDKIKLSIYPFKEEVKFLWHRFW